MRWQFFRSTRTIKSPHRIRELTKKYEGELTLMGRDLALMDDHKPGRTYQTPNDVINGAREVIHMAGRLSQSALSEAAWAHLVRAHLLIDRETGAIPNADPGWPHPPIPKTPVR